MIKQVVNYQSSVKQICYSRQAVGGSCLNSYPNNMDPKPTTDPFNLWAYTKESPGVEMQCNAGKVNPAEEVDDAPLSLKVRLGFYDE